MAGDEGKGGEFGSIPDDLFGELVQLYATFAFANPSDAVKGLAQLAKAEHAAATATKVPHPVTLTILCIDLGRQMDNLQAAKNPIDIGTATAALFADLQKLEGLWK